MNRGQQFWHQAWSEGRISFHQSSVNTDLVLYWPRLGLSPGARVLVPLCGKSLDMLWLMQQGYIIDGIELSEQAIGQFVNENQLTMIRREQDGMVTYTNKKINIWVDDIFEINPQVFELPLAAIYDRAALVALPKQLRQQYVDFCLATLADKGKILLKTITYNQDLLEGPPFSVEDEEVCKLYSKCKNVQLINKKINNLEPDNHLYQRGLTETEDSVWIIEK